MFHPNCVDEWLKNWNRVCPLCKAPISRSRQRREREPLLNDLESEEASNYGSIRMSDSAIEDNEEEDEVVSDTAASEGSVRRNTNSV